MNKYRKTAVSLILTAVLLMSGIIFIKDINAAEQQTQWDYSYTGNIQSWTAPYSGKYKIVLKGASGGTSAALSAGVTGEALPEYGGEGGITTIEIPVMQGQTYYLGVGGEGKSGTNAAGGYNGGGKASGKSGSGGGATHIATKQGLLSEAIAEDKDCIVAVAAGGGGSASNYYWITKGPDIGTLPYRIPMVGRATAGGAEQSSDMNRFLCGDKSLTNYAWANEYYNSFEWQHLVENQGYATTISGSTYDSGYKMGIGENGKNGSGGGGAGWYGGLSGTKSYDGAVGGSSYAFGQCLSSNNKEGGNRGNGSISITYEGPIKSTVNFDLGKYGTYDGKNSFTINCNYGDTITVPKITNNEGYRIRSFEEAIKSNYYNKESFVVDNINLNLKAVGIANLNIEATDKDNAVSIKLSEDDEISKKYIIYQWRSDIGWSYANFDAAVEKAEKTLEKSFTPVKHNETYDITSSSFYLLQAASGKAGLSYDAGSKWYGKYGGSFEGYIALKEGDAITVTVGSNGGNGHSDTDGEYDSSVDYPGKNGWPYSGYYPNGGLNGAVDWGDGNQANGGRGGYTKVQSNNLGELIFIEGGHPYARAAGHVSTAQEGYVKSYNNAFSYVSKTNGTATSGYVKLYNLGSLFVDNNYYDNMYIKDLAAPNIPKDGKWEYVEDGKYNITWNDDGDNGTLYKYYAESYDAKTDELLSTSQQIEYSYVSGVKGFHYYIDTSTTGTVTKDHTYQDGNNLQIDVPEQKMYMHVAAIDNADNLGPTYTFEIPSVAKYAVNHYAQNEDGSYTLVKTEEFTDTIGKTVTPETYPQIGRNTPEKQSIVITADGKAVVNYYYDITRFDISGTVQWNDHENEYGTRPDSVDVTIYRNGIKNGVVTVPSPSTSNKYSFKNMQKYDLTTGALLNYTVSQSTAYSQAALITTEDKYTTTNSGFDFLNTIKNTDLDKPEIPPEGDKGFFLEGNIIWEDNENSLGFRPDTVSIQLWQKGVSGEFIKFGEPIAVDANTENHYSFDWLPKYWYDENDIPTAYEYKTEEIFEAWYIQDGVMKNAYTINVDTPNKFDFTNIFNIPDGPVIPVSQYENTLIVKTNTEEHIRVILKPLELNIDNGFNVSYGNETGENTEVITNNTGDIVKGLPSTRYEIVVDSKEYDITDMNLSLAENMELEKIGDKWYLTIYNQPEDVIGTLTINLEKHEWYYQDTCRISNFYAHISEAAVASILTSDISLFSLKASNAVTVEYMNTGIEVETYSVGDEIKIADFIGEIPEGMEFEGWATSENGEVEYVVGDTITIEDSFVLHPVFKAVIETNKDISDIESSTILGFD